MNFISFLVLACLALVVDCDSSIPKLSRHGRIYNGRDIQKNELAQYKHQVKLGLLRSEGGFTCSGSIITQFTVITAAHCLRNVIKMDLYFGLRENVDIYYENRIQKQTVDSSAFRMHPDYNKTGRIENDVGLIILPKPIVISDIVSPIQMALPSDKCYGYAGKRVVVSGWGKINDRGDVPDFLQTTIVTIANSDECSKIFTVDKNKIVCSSSLDGTGVCHGDSGGPVVLDVNGTPTLIGISSYIQGPNCISPSPTVSTCIAAFDTWIQQNLK